MELLNTLVQFFLTYGYFAVFGVLLLCGFGLPVPEDITLVSGGVISSFGKTNVHIMLIVGMAGVMVGDSFVFLAGYFKGSSILKWKPVAYYITEERYKKVQEKFEKYGRWVVFMARFMPGLRTPIFLTAGVSRKVGFWRFFTMDFFAAIISVPVWVYLGYYGASNFDKLLDWVHKGQITILAILGVAILFFLYFFFKKRKSKSV
ncbi:MAG: DedA family protein [Leptospiraceae bacterium]|nr:DedA family protein [Leptospiraceae bacterium]